MTMSEAKDDSLLGRAMSVSGFKAWVAGRSPHEAYNYTDACACAFSQYLQSLGYPHAVVTSTWFKTDRREAGVALLTLPDGIDDAVSPHPWAFGALSKRLELLP
jgi:hypothetical protein